MSRPVALAVVGLALLAALLLSLAPGGLLGSQAATTGYEREGLVGIQRHQGGTTTERLWITDDWHSVADNQYAINPAPVRRGILGAQAATTGYEWEVLPGIQRDRSGNVTVHLWITDDWHSVADNQYAIDFAPVGRDILDGCPHPVTDTSACVSDPVHATFRNTSGGQELSATFRSIPETPGSCKGVEATVENQDGAFVGYVRYKHVIHRPLPVDAVALSTLAAAPLLLGTIAVPHPMNPRLEADPPTHYTNILNAHEEMVDHIGCENTGPHLHQSTVPGTSGVVQRNRDAAAELGISGDWGCIAPAMWIWKIALSTPAVTATKAPTPWVCPSTLTVQSGVGGAVAVDPVGGPYVADEDVTVTAEPDDGYQIDSWGDDCATTGAGDPTCELAMNAAKTASVTFAADGDDTPPPGDGTPPPLTITASVAPSSCLTGAAVTIDWEVHNASGEVSVSTVGHFVDRSRDTGRFVNVPCMDEAGEQSAALVAVDHGPPLRRASAIVRWSVNARSGGDCLTYSGVNTYAVWRADCASTTAATLLNALDDIGACGIWLWQDPDWVGYSVTSDGTLVADSENFMIAAGNILWIGGCDSSRGSAIGPPGPPPIPFPS